MLTDALGSVDVVTDGSGSVTERRSYDAFGARRNPAWGSNAAQAPAVSPVGFTGQEDDELGLVNMKGRIYDPTVGRFLTTDPLVSRPGFTQSWNPYSYVWNSPLSFTDPSGFAPGDNPNGGNVGAAAIGPSDVTFGTDRINADAGFQVAACLGGGACGSAAPGASTAAKDAARDDAKGGAATSTDTGGTPVAASPSSTATAVDIAKGVALGVNDAYVPDPVSYFKAVSGMTIVDNAVKGWRERGVSGALVGAANAANPLYNYSIGVIETRRKANAGDTVGATAGAVQLGIGVVGPGGRGGRRGGCWSGRDGGGDRLDVPSSKSGGIRGHHGNGAVRSGTQRSKSGRQAVRIDLGRGAQVL